MEPISSLVVVGAARTRGSWLLPVALTVLAAGCVPLDGFVGTGAKPLQEPVCQVAATWYPEVVSTPDPTKRGAPTPGLAGRMYLFGTEVAAPLVGDGSVRVELYDDTHAEPGKPQIPLEVWNIDKVTLDRLKRRDPVGWGYTLFLPWGSYKPEITRVHLRLCYKPAKGAPLYHEGEGMALHKEGSELPPMAGRQGPLPDVVSHPAQPAAHGS
jgi:hypothetical protein